MRSKISELFHNTLTAYHIYSRHNSENLPQHGQKLLSLKPKPFCRIFIPFLQSTQGFAHSEEKDQLNRLNIWEVIESEKRGYFSPLKLRF